MSVFLGSPCRCNGVRRCLQCCGRPTVNSCSYSVDPHCRSSNSSIERARQRQGILQGQQQQHSCSSDRGEKKHKAAVAPPQIVAAAAAAAGGSCLSSSQETQKLFQHEKSCRGSILQAADDPTAATGATAKAAAAAVARGETQGASHVGEAFTAAAAAAQVVEEAEEAAQGRLGRRPSTAPEATEAAVGAPAYAFPPLLHRRADAAAARSVVAAAASSSPDEASVARGHEVLQWRHRADRHFTEKEVVQLYLCQCSSSSDRSSSNDRRSSSSSRRDNSSCAGRRTNKTSSSGSSRDRSDSCSSHSGGSTAIDSSGSSSSGCSSPPQADNGLQLLRGAHSCCDVLRWGVWDRPTKKSSSRLRSSNSSYSGNCSRRGDSNNSPSSSSSSSNGSTCCSTPRRSSESGQAIGGSSSSTGTAKSRVSIACSSNSSTASSNSVTCGSAISCDSNDIRSRSSTGSSNSTSCSSTNTERCSIGSSSEGEKTDIGSPRHDDEQEAAPRACCCGKSVQQNGSCCTVTRLQQQVETSPLHAATAFAAAETQPFFSGTAGLAAVTAPTAPAAGENAAAAEVAGQERQEAVTAAEGVSTTFAAAAATAKVGSVLSAEKERKQLLKATADLPVSPAVSPVGEGLAKRSSAAPASAPNIPPSPLSRRMVRASRGGEEEDAASCGNGEAVIQPLYVGRAPAEETAATAEGRRRRLHAASAPGPPRASPRSCGAASGRSAAKEGRAGSLGTAASLSDEGAAETFAAATEPSTAEDVVVVATAAAAAPGTKAAAAHVATAAADSAGRAAGGGGACAAKISSTEKAAAAEEEIAYTIYFLWCSTCKRLHQQINEPRGSCGAMQTAAPPAAATKSQRTQAAAATAETAAAAAARAKCAASEDDVIGGRGVAAAVAAAAVAAAAAAVGRRGESTKPASTAAAAAEAAEAREPAPQRALQQTVAAVAACGKREARVKKSAGAAGSQRLSAATGENILAAAATEQQTRGSAEQQAAIREGRAAAGATAAAGAAAAGEDEGGTADSSGFSGYRRLGGTSEVCEIHSQNPLRKHGLLDEWRAANAKGEEKGEEEEGEGEEAPSNSKGRKGRVGVAACPWRGLCVAESGASASEAEDDEEVLLAAAAEASTPQTLAARVAAAAGAADPSRAEITAPPCAYGATATAAGAAAEATLVGHTTAAAALAAAPPPLSPATAVSKPAAVLRGTPAGEAAATGICCRVAVTPKEATPSVHAGRMTAAGAAAEAEAPGTPVMAAAHTESAAAVEAAFCCSSSRPANTVYPHTAACLAAKEDSAAAAADAAAAACASGVALAADDAAAASCPKVAAASSPPPPPACSPPPTAVACLTKGEILRAVAKALLWGGKGSRHLLPRLRPQQQQKHQQQQQQLRFPAAEAAEAGACRAGRKAKAATAVTRGVPSAEEAARGQQAAAGLEINTGEAAGCAPAAAAAAADRGKAASSAGPHRQTNTGHATREGRVDYRGKNVVAAAAAAEQRWLASTAAGDGSGAFAAQNKQLSAAAAGEGGGRREEEEISAAEEQLFALLQLHENDLIGPQESEGGCCCGSFRGKSTAVSAIPPFASGDLCTACQAKAQNTTAAAAAAGIAAADATGHAAASSPATARMRPATAAAAAEEASAAGGMPAPSGATSDPSSCSSLCAAAVGKAAAAAAAEDIMRCTRGSTSPGKEQQQIEAHRQPHTRNGRDNNYCRLSAAPFGVYVVEEALSKDEEAHILRWADEGLPPPEEKNAAATAGEEAAATRSAEAAAAAEAQGATPAGVAPPATADYGQQGRLRDRAVEKKEKGGVPGGTQQEDGGVSAAAAAAERMFSAGKWVPSQSGRMKMDFGPRVNFRKQRFKIDTFCGFPSFMRPLLQRFSRSFLYDSPSRPPACPSSSCASPHIPHAGFPTASAAACPSPATTRRQPAEEAATGAAASEALSRAAFPAVNAAVAAATAEKCDVENEERRDVVSQTAAAAPILLRKPAPAAADVARPPADAAAAAAAHVGVSRLHASPAAATGIEICATSRSEFGKAEGTVGEGPRAEGLTASTRDGPVIVTAAAAAGATPEKHSCFSGEKDRGAVFPEGSAARGTDTSEGMIMLPSSQADSPALPLLEQFYPVELCLLDYLPSRGSHIEEHIDDAWFWGPRLLTFSLAGATFLSFISPTMCLPLSHLNPLLRRTAAARKPSRSTTRKGISSSGSRCRAHQNVDQGQIRRSSSSMRGELDGRSRERIGGIRIGEGDTSERREGNCLARGRPTDEEPIGTEMRDEEALAAAMAPEREKRTTADEGGRLAGIVGAAAPAAGTEATPAAGAGGDAGAALAAGGAVRQGRHIVWADRSTKTTDGEGRRGRRELFFTEEGGDEGNEDMFLTEEEGGGKENLFSTEGGGGKEDLFLAEKGVGSRDEEGSEKIFIRVRVEVRVPLPARSMVVVTGAARYKWAHAIRAHHVSERRVALTLRELSAEFLKGEEMLGRWYGQIYITSRVLLVTNRRAGDTVRSSQFYGGVNVERLQEGRESAVCDMRKAAVVEVIKQSNS